MDSIDILAVIVAGVIGCGLGGAAIQESWKDDCEKVGFHRVGDKVYECKLKGGA